MAVELPAALLREGMTQVALVGGPVLAALLIDRDDGRRGAPSDPPPASETDHDATRPSACAPAATTALVAERPS